MCSKGIVVFYKKDAGVITVPMPFLGFQKITQAGTYSIYCAEGYQREDYPEGWLYEVDEKGNKIPGTDNPEANDPEEGNLGISPIGFPLFGLPGWLWLLIVAGVLIYYGSDE